MKSVIDGHEIAGRLPTFKPQLRAKVRIGDKLQTRRVMRKQPPSAYKPTGYGVSTFPEDKGKWGAEFHDCAHEATFFPSPYGKAGDIRMMTEPLAKCSGSQRAVYADDGAGWFSRKTDEPMPWRWKRDLLTSMYMPTEAGRTLVEVKRVCVERLQDISEEDALAEGATFTCPACGNDEFTDPDGSIHWACDDSEYMQSSYREGFRRLWDSINAKPKPSKRNPYTGGLEKCFVSYPWEDVQEIREHRGLKWYVIGNPWKWAISWRLL